MTTRVVRRTTAFHAALLLFIVGPRAHRLVAQGAARASTVPVDMVPVGTFRGTVMAKENAADQVDPPPRPAAGSARWRLELDSLDWRRKFTLRIGLSQPDDAVLVIRAAGPDAPRRTLRLKNDASSHTDRDYFTVAMYVREGKGARVYDDWAIGEDTLVLDAAGPLTPSTIVRGTFRLRGFHRGSTVRTPRGHVGAASSRTLRGSFAAAFDPRPVSVPRTMTTELQAAIMRRALHEFAVTWMSAKLQHGGPADSTFADPRARAFLDSRWSEAAIVDSLSTDYTHFFVRMRGRYAPVTCIVTDTAGAPGCYTTRHWWSRFF